MDTSRDSLDRHCPRLGGTIFFEYCRTCGDEDQPCWKIADCWWEVFDIMSYLRENLTATQLNQLLEKKEQPQPKVTSLIDLIEQARLRS
ncbi:MAG: hypothetical protein ABIK68_16260 [bacterium]